MTSMGPVHAIVCRQLVEVVTDYLEGDLDPATHAAVEAHLADCDHCRAYVEQMRITTRALRETRTAELPEDRRRELLGVFRVWAEEREG